MSVECGEKVLREIFKAIMIAQFVKPLESCLREKSYSRNAEQVCTEPDTSYLCGSEVFHSFPVQVSMKVHEDICIATASLLHTTRADSAEGFATGLCTSDCVDSR